MHDSSRETNKSGSPQLITVEEAKNLTAGQVSDLFRLNINPGQYHFLKLLGFHEVIIDRAEGMYYYTRSGKKIMDFFGGFGSLSLGHNHPRILAVRQKFQEEKRHEIAIAFMSQYAAALAYNLAAIAPGDLDMVFLGSTGSEAVEAALKLAEKAADVKQHKIVYAEKSFHGKTLGALSVTDSTLYQSSFELPHNRVRVPFGDAGALEKIFENDKEIGVLILETIQGGAGIVTAPPEYWQRVRQLCDQYKVIWIADEVQCGVGKTGYFFAFEQAGVIPDIVTLAKSLGGGKAAIGAMISRKPLFLKAYGTPGTAMIQGSSTFGGIGETCCTAIEALNVLYEEGLIENAAIQGARLISQLQDLRSKYPTLIKEVRGQGLMIGIEFHDFSQTLAYPFRKIVSALDEKLKGSVCGFVGSILFRDHNILVAFTEYNRNVIRLHPPMIVTAAEIDRFAGALDEVLGRGITHIITDYTKNFFRKNAG